MKTIVRTLLTCISVLFCSVAFATDFNVRKYGAKGDGVHIDTPAFNKAIEKASKSKDGVVVIPKGEYLCYSIRLKSNITLKFEDGATIKAAKPDGNMTYDLAEEFEGKTYQDFGHSHWKNSLMWGIGLDNIHIKGKGIIDGKDVLSRGPRKGETVANKAIAMKNCTNVEIRDITLLSCGHFALLLTGVDNLVIDNVMADTNRDGFDIDCCENVRISNCKVNTFADDAIVLKCSYALGKMKPTANVLIENCEVSGYDERTLYDGTRQTVGLLAPDRDGPTGRIKLGTESNGGFHDIRIQNCTLTHCRGLAFETVDGALLENVSVENITMSDICNSPIYMIIGTRMRAPEGTKPSQFRNLSLKNIKARDCDSRYAILISGQPDNYIENISMEDVDIEFRGGLTLEDVRTQKGRNLFFQKHDPHYPEPSVHGIQPAWGVSVEHVKNMSLKNISLRLTSPDERPMVFMNDILNSSVDPTQIKKL